jgi:hypothetical protein
MSAIENVTLLAPVMVDKPLSLQELTTILIKHYKKHSGRFELQAEYQVGAGPFGPDATKMAPSVIIGLIKVSLVESRSDGPMTVDAAAVNPFKKPRKRTA